MEAALSAGIWQCKYAAADSLSFGCIFALLRGNSMLISSELLAFFLMV